MISKFYWQILVSFRLAQNLETSGLALEKVEKDNIAVTYRLEFQIFCGLYYKSCMIVIYDCNNSAIVGPVL